MIYSDRFPALGGTFIAPELRGAYYRALEVSDTYTRGQQGDKESPGNIPPGQGDLQTTPKAKPPTKGEGSVVPEGPGECKAEEETVNKAPVIKEERKSPLKERKSRSEGVEGRERARSSGVRRQRERSPERSKRDQEELKTRERRGDSRRERSPLRRDRRDRPRDERKERDRGEERARRSPLRPRSPAGPPPPREDPSQRWRGPIPAYSNQPHHQHYGRYNDGQPEPQNKGVKKRKQQALFSEFKAWRKRQQRNYRR